MSLLTILFRSSSKVHPTEVHPTDTYGSYYGPLVYGKRHGHGKYIEGSVEYVGEWQHDNIHGEGCIKNTANKMSFMGIFVMNTMVYGTYTWPNGSTYVGEFENNEMHGQGSLKWSSGEKYEGEFENGAMHGQGTYTDKNGIVCNIEYCKGKVVKLEKSNK